MQQSPTLGQLFGRMFWLIGGHPLSTLFSIILLAAIGTAGDLYPGDVALALDLGSVVVLLTVQYGVTHRVLRDEGLLDHARRPSIWSFIGFNIFGNIAIGLATMLLIVPGVYLLARWSAAIPIIVGEGATMGEAMDKSTGQTAQARTPIMLLMALCSLPWAGSLIWFLWATSAAPETNGMAVTFNTMIYLSTVLTWFGSLAVYTLTQDRGEDELEAVFA